MTEIKTPWDARIRELEETVAITTISAKEHEFLCERARSYRQGYAAAEAKYADLLAAAELALVAINKLPAKQLQAVDGENAFVALIDAIATLTKEAQCD